MYAAALALCAVVACRHGAADRARGSVTEEASHRAPAPQASSATTPPKPRLLYTGDPATSAPPPQPNSTTVASTAPAASAPSNRPTRYRVAFMGDSLTDAASHGGKFIDYLEARCPESRFDNFGKGADMVNQMRRRFLAEVYPRGGETYSHVVIFGGVNDLYSDQTAHRTNERIQTDLSQMYTWARQHGAQVVAITVAPWGGFSRYFNARRHANTLALNRWIEAQQGQAVDFVIDAHELLRCGDAERLCPEYAKPFRDGIHFGPQGHEVLGRALYEQVFQNCR